MEVKIDKGYAMEEAIRLYFLRSGYYVVRGVPFVYRGFDVTDIDIWAYDRPSALSRYRLIVDCKNKSTPKAIERIFWTKGLKEVVGADAAAVATTEKRAEIADFGRRYGVMILDGNFLRDLQKSGASSPERLTEEEFTALVTAYSPVKDAQDWKTRLRMAKQPLAGSLNFSSANYWIDSGRYFAEQMQLVATHRDTACRVVYLMLSFVAVALDFSLREYAFTDSTQRYTVVEQGLRNGAPGATSTGQVMQLAMGLIEHYAPENRGVGNKIRQRLSADLDKLPTKMLAEFICKPAVSLELFRIAKDLETAAYARTFTSPQQLDVLSKGFYLLFLDFWGMDRSAILDSFGVASKEQSPSAIKETSEVKGAAPAQIQGSSESVQPELPGMSHLAKS